MNNRIIIGHKTWSETPAMVLEKMDSLFPNLQSYYKIGKGKISHLIHPKKAYRLGVVFPLVDKDGKKETVVYYPMKDAFVRYFCPLPYFPVQKYESIAMQTKRGFMRVVYLEGAPALAFENGYTRVE